MTIPKIYFHLLFKQKQIEAALELSIFKFEGETLNLTLDKVDFVETGSFELELSAEYLKPYQLHKGVINGDLRTRSDQTKKTLSVPWFLNRILLMSKN